MAAPNPIGYVIAQEVGNLGRVHFHALITGVATLDREYWESKAERIIGRTRLRTYVAALGGASYIVKALPQEGCELHFGGVLAGIDVSRVTRSDRQNTNALVTAPSDPLPSTFFHATLRGRHR
jgi:hypothetical protein